MYLIKTIITIDQLCNHIAFMHVSYGKINIVDTYNSISCVTATYIDSQGPMNVYNFFWYNSNLFCYYKTQGY